MDISDVFNRLNFFINKFTGGWYTIPELEDLTDSASISVYSDYKPKYATSQLVKDILSPFKQKYPFTPSDMISGYVIVPANTNYLDLLDLQTTFQISNLTVYYPVPLPNEDERANRLNSQIDPVTVTNPIAEQVAPRYFLFYPAGNQYTGIVTFLRRPIKPVFGYSVVSGRIIVYDPNTSVQLEWRQTELNYIILKALEIAGVNLSSQELAGFAENKTAQNFSGVNRL